MTVNELIAELERLVNDGHGELDVTIDTEGCSLDIDKVKMVGRYKAKAKVWITCS